MLTGIAHKTTRLRFPFLFWEATCPPHIISFVGVDEGIHDGLEDRFQK